MISPLCCLAAVVMLLVFSLKIVDVSLYLFIFATINVKY